jgi:phosphocarrier protein
MGLMMLAAGPGSSIRIAASGPQAAEALAMLCALVEEKFGEEE